MSAEPKTLFNTTDSRIVVTGILIALLLLMAVVILRMVYEGRIPISGQIDIGIVLGFIITVIGSAMGWLYGKPRQS